MTNYLTVNADDFGMTEGTNRAIVDAHTTGIVTSTSVLANGLSFDHAIALAKQSPELGIGVHLTLTEGFPVSNALDPFLRKGQQQLQSSLEEETRPLLPISNQPYARALLAGTLPRRAIRAEFEAQIQKVIDAGIAPTHIDGHKYIHLLPGIASVVADLARTYRIPVMRVPYRILDSWGRVSRVPGRIAIKAMGILAYQHTKRAHLISSDRLAGFVDTGHLTEEIVQALLHNPRAGTTELLCHPAYFTDEHRALLGRGYNWIATYEFAQETSTVSSSGLRKTLINLGWSLTSFRKYGT